MNPLHDLLVAIDGDEEGMVELRMLEETIRRVGVLEAQIGRLHDNFYAIADKLNDKYEAGIDTYCLREQFSNGFYDPEELA